MKHVPNEPIFRKDEYEAKLLLQKPKFQNAVSVLRQKWGVPDEGFVNQKSHNSWQLKMAVNSRDEYEGDVSRVLKDLSLTERWHRGVSEYIQLNAPATLKTRPHNAVKIEADGEGNLGSVWIQVDKDTTRPELVEAFKNAQDLLGAEDKKQPLDKLDRDLAVLERHNDGLKNKELAAWLNENYEGAFNTEDVKTILKRTKRRLS